MESKEQQEQVAPAKAEAPQPEVSALLMNELGLGPFAALLKRPKQGPSRPALAA